MTHQKVIALTKQTVVTDWEKVARSVNAVIIRMGYRGQTTGQIVEDPKFRHSLKACQTYDIPYGLFFFSCAINEQEAIDEAEWIIKRIPSTDQLAFPIFVSNEITGREKKVGRSDKLAKDVRNRCLKAFCETLNKAGIPVGIYGSNLWLTNELDMGYLNYPVWLMQYEKEITYKGNCILWQYSSGCTVPGISGGISMSKEVKTRKPKEVVEQVPVEKTEEKVFTGVVTMPPNFDLLRIRESPNGADTGKRIINGARISYTKIQNGFGKLKDCEYGEGWVLLDYVK